MELAGLLSEALDGGVAVGYADIVGDSQADRRIAFALQTAVALAVDNVTDPESEAQALASAAEGLLDTPKPRAVSIFSQRDGGDVNPALAQEVAGTPLNIHVYEGEISLPYYQGIPELQMAQPYNPPTGRRPISVQTNPWMQRPLTASATAFHLPRKLETPRCR